ncbi:Permuted papain-like amidase enzyme, YaeF/YiiX, C92 family [Bradyrhizobium shewense]|uniref:Permuted papain-like amidase enzyme, YaeF/YiiX, C92 family n=1 Tax=Bradyrhizobium shewense TaxID=1761772 RepID=A0A1C3XIH2_9BRAD|nr:Permuted papain-like amidase enzyme, YaeF/YiiX, C92 family [Bradyrhizobium shewense]
MSGGLTPDQGSEGSVAVEQELPAAAREWGRIIETKNLLPGDLVLVRSISPDRVSKSIENAQLKGGFPQRHAQWTHAAVYLGDGEYICESTFKESLTRGGVVMRSLFNYCDGKHAIRVRRPKVSSDRQRIKIVIGALNHMGKSYSWFELLSFMSAAQSGRGFWQNGQRQRIRTGALVCSTLYQDAFNFSFSGTTVRMGTLCTPAHLSASPDFENASPHIGWLALD